MVEVIIHIGMGKTGGGALHAALAASDVQLRAAGISYLVGHDIPVLPVGDQMAAADALADHLIGAGPQRFIISNPDYFERADEIQPFLHRLDQRVALRILVWMRPIHSWLASLEMHGSVLHDPGNGSSSVEVSAQQVATTIASYARLLRWTAVFGSAVTVRAFHEAGDIVEDCGALIGVTLTAPLENRKEGVTKQHAEMLAQVSHAAGFDIAMPAGDAMYGRDVLPGLRAEIAFLQQRLAVAEQKHEAVALQLRRQTQPQLQEVRDRLRLAIALDDPQTLYSAAAVTAEVQRLRAEGAEDRIRMRQREAELLSSTSWRITAPLRAVSRLLRGMSRTGKGGD